MCDVPFMVLLMFNWLHSLSLQWQQDIFSVLSQISGAANVYSRCYLYLITRALLLMPHFAAVSDSPKTAWVVTCTLSVVQEVLLLTPHLLQSASLQLQQLSRHQLDGACGRK